MLRLAALVALLAAAPAHAQIGFGAFNGRNHPELDWQVARTEHFEIMTPAHLAGLQAQAAAVAEASFAALTANLGPSDSVAVAFRDPIRIYLSDEDEIANGIAFPIGPSGFTTIWVHVNDTAEIWTGDAKWLRKVLAHELAHIVHYRAVRSGLGLLDVFFGDPLPSFWTEGLAQYQTERWDAQRGDRWLRTAVFEDRLSYDDGTSVQNGRLLYASGNSQVRRFAELYGDSTLARLLAHRIPVLGGLGRVHDFQAAFRATTGQPYREFQEDWRRHVNVYYNTLAGQMERLDSLGVDPLGVPGQVVYAVAYSPDTTQVAAVVLPSLARPVRRLIVVDRRAQLADSTARPRLRILADGALVGPVAWSPDGRAIAYARERRGRHGSFVRDLYTVDVATGRRRRLTTDRRATSPTFSPDGTRLAFVGAAGPGGGSSATANLYTRDLATGAERALTAYAGDVQITSAAWSPDGARVAYAVTGPDGRRDLATVDVATGRVETLPTGAGIGAATRDDRGPVWSPDGRRLAFTSLRDGAPNVFVADWATGEEARATFLFVGATVHDWLPPDSAHAEGRLVVVSSETKRRDRAYAIPADRRPTVPAPLAPQGVASGLAVPAAYASWTTQAPPREIPYALAPDSTLIRSRGAYASWRHLTRAITLPFPYGDPGEDGALFTADDDWGAFVTSLWVEPLGKHQLTVLAGLSVTRPADRSFFVVDYVNRQLAPTLGLSLYRFPSPSSFYGTGVLVEDLTGGDVSASWPLDGVTDRPYSAVSAGARLRYAYAAPLSAASLGDADAAGGVLPVPEAGTRFDVRGELAYRFQRPYRYNVIFPLDGTGVRLRTSVGVPGLGATGAFVRPDLLAFWVSPSLGGPRLLLQGRATAQFGAPQLPQDYVGLARYDDVDVQIPFVGAVTLDDAERVRGYRRYAVGTRALFGSAELRLPVLFDLNTTLLGLVRLGAVSPAVFADGGLVWTGSDLSGAVRRLGVGTELKNVVSFGGFELLHALGVALPAGRLGDVWDGSLPWADVDIYYRVQAALPF